MNALRLTQYKNARLQDENNKLKGLTAFLSITLALGVFSIFWLGLFNVLMMVSK